MTTYANKFYQAYLDYQSRGPKSRFVPFEPQRRKRRAYRKSMNNIKRYRRKQRSATVVKNVKKEVKKLKRLNEATMGELIYRSITAQLLHSLTNQTEYSFISCCNTTQIEFAIAQLKYFDPSTPSTLITTDFTTGSYHKEINIESCSLNVLLRSNYKVPVMIDVYRCMVRKDTSINPKLAMQNQDSDLSNADYTSPLVYPTDFSQLTDLWNIKRVGSMYLEAGKQKSFNIHVNDFSYDPSLVDDHTLTYQKALKGSGILIRISGTLAHDSTLTEYGIPEAKIDILFKRTIKVKYNAGADLKYVYVQDNLNSFTNVPHLTNKPTGSQQILST